MSQRTSIFNKKMEDKIAYGDLSQTTQKWEFCTLNMTFRQVVREVEFEHKCKARQKNIIMTRVSLKPQYLWLIVVSYWLIKFLDNIYTTQVLIRSLFGKRFLTTLFKFCKNTCEWKSMWKYILMKKYVEIRVVVFKWQFMLFKHC